MKKSYLICLKNELLARGLNFTEIHDILADIGIYFDDAVQEESAQKSVLEKLGTPKEFAKSIQQTDTLQSAGNIRFFRMLSIVMIPLLFFIGIFFLMEDKQEIIVDYRQAIVSVLVFASMVLLWFMSGNMCLLGIIPLKKEQVKKWVCFQVFLLVSMIAFLYGIYVGVPLYIKMAVLQNTLYTVGSVICFISSVYATLHIGIAIYGLIYFFQGECLMFGIVMQSFGLMCCAVFYYQYLGSLTQFREMHYFPVPLLLSISFSSIIYIMILVNKDGKQNGCAD